MRLIFSFLFLSLFFFRTKSLIRTYDQSIVMANVEGASFFNFSWNVRTDVLEMAMQCQGCGYLAGGFSSSGFMDQSDIFVAYEDSQGTPIINDYWSGVGYYTPSLDSTQDILLVSAVTAYGIYSIEFEKPLLPFLGESRGEDLSIQDPTSPITAIFAMSDQTPVRPESFIYHSWATTQEIILGPPQPHGPFTQSYGNYLIISNSFPRVILYWNIVGDMISIAIEYDSSEGMLALGFSRSGGMINSDVIAAFWEGDQAVISDYYTTNERITPQLDTVSDVTLVSSLRTPDTCYVEIERPLITSDPYDFPIDSLTNPIPVIFASSTKNPPNIRALPYHDWTSVQDITFGPSHWIPRPSEPSSTNTDTASHVISVTKDEQDVGDDDSRLFVLLVAIIGGLALFLVILSILLLTVVLVFRPKAEPQAKKQKKQKKRKIISINFSDSEEDFVPDAILGNPESLVKSSSQNFQSPIPDAMISYASDLEGIGQISDVDFDSVSSDSV